MSEVWAAPLCDPRPNRRDRAVPNLQCRDHSSDPKYLTSTTPAFAGASESRAHQIRMSEVWPTPLRDRRPNRHDRTMPNLQCHDHSSDPKYFTCTTAFGRASEYAQNRHMGHCSSSNRPATLLDCSRCNRWHSTFHRRQTHGVKNVHLPLREGDDERHQNLPYVRSTLSVIAAIVSSGVS